MSKLPAMPDFASKKAAVAARVEAHVIKQTVSHASARNSLGESGISNLFAQPNDHFNTRDLVPLRDFRYLAECELRIGDIDQLVAVLEIKMMMR